MDTPEASWWKRERWVCKWVTLSLERLLVQSKYIQTWSEPVRIDWAKAWMFWGVVFSLLICFIQIPHERALSVPVITGVKVKQLLYMSIETTEWNSYCPRYRWTASGACTLPPFAICSEVSQFMIWLEAPWAADDTHANAKQPCLSVFQRRIDDCSRGDSHSELMLSFSLPN